MDGQVFRFGVLGPLLVERDGEAVPLPRSSVLRGLLGVLLLAEGGALTAERLAGLVWGDRSNQVGRGSVHVGISRLRRRLEGVAAVESHSDGYRLATPPRALDLSRLRAGLAEASGIGDPAARCALLRDLVRLSRGPVLVDLAGLDRADPLVRSAEADLREAGLALGRAALAAGQAQVAIAPLEELVRTHPFDEPLHAELLELLADCGRPAEALRHYELLRARLAEELGVSPSEQVQRVHLAVLGGDHELAAPAATATGGDGPVGAAAPVASWSTPAQLPADGAAFTGRREHLRRLDAALAAGDRGRPGDVAIWAIDGMAGVGKTALAVHWAHRAAAHFPDGQLFVSLRGHAAGAPLRPIDALAGFLHALGVPAEQVPVEVDEAAGLYRTLLAGKRVLVVLDDARSAEQVRPLLPGGPGCLVVVTSRGRLGGLIARDGASRLTLEVLTVAEALALLERLLGAERVAAEAEAARDLARLCAYLPLALRIAAAYLGGHPNDTIASRVADLAGGDRLAGLAVDGDEQTAVRSAFALSYAALAPEARRTFRLLGLVPGIDVTVPCVAALTGDPPARAAALLDRLVGAHLLEERLPGRFAFHDLLRLYAAERVRDEDDADDRDRANGRLFDWYLGTADAAARLLYPEKLRLPLPPTGREPPAPPFEDHVGALAWLDAELPNLVATTRHAADRGPRRVASLLADVLRGYFWLRISTVDWLTVARAGLDAAEADGEERAQAAAWLSLADAHLRQGQWEQAIECYGRALALNQRTGWLDAQAANLGNLGSVYWWSGRLPEAADHYLRALAIDRRTGRLAGQALALGNLGVVSMELGRLRQAAVHHAQALALNQRIGSRYGQALNLEGLGETCHALGQLDQALEHVRRALAVHREIGNRGPEASCQCILAMVHLDAGRHALALAHARTAAALAREVGERRYEAEALVVLADARRQLGEHRPAIEDHLRALRLARATTMRYPEVKALVGLAGAHRQLGQCDAALDHAERGRAIAHQAGYRVLEGQAVTAVAAVHLDRGDRRRAAEHARQALALHRDTCHRLGEARTLVVLGHALWHGGDRDRAGRCWRHARTLFTQIGTPEAEQVNALLEGRSALLEP